MNRELLAQIDQIERERLRRLGRTDRVAFAKSLAFRPDPWQEQVLRSDNQRLLLNCCRQAGKSTIASILALHRAVYFPKSVVLLISPSLRQSGELLRKVQDFLPELPVKPVLHGDSKTVVELQNGSRIISLPATESTIRTFTASMIIEDEAGDVPDELHQAILPMLIVSRGRLILQGTPKGRIGHFFESWERQPGLWEKIEVPFTQVPRIDLEEIARQRIALREVFEQEYMCKFIQGGSGMVYGAFDEKRNVIPALPETKNPKSWSYMLGIDFGYVDSTAFVLVGWRPNDANLYVILSVKEPHMLADDIAKKIHEIQAVYPLSRIIGDSTGYGKGPIEEIRRRHHLPIEPAEKTGKSGYIDLLNADLAAGRLKILKDTNGALVQEIVSLPWNDSRTNQRDGFEDHLCDAMLYVWRAGTQYLQSPVQQKPQTKEEQIKIDTKEYWERVEKAMQDEREDQDFMEQADPLGEDPFA